MPNYNLNKLVRRSINQMKREYGSPITVYQLQETKTDLTTGEKTAVYTSIPVRRAVVLPVKIEWKVLQTISLVSANKKTVQGGGFDAGSRKFIIDRRDVPGIELTHADWLVYDHRRYDIQAIKEFEQKVAWLVTAIEVKDVRPEEHLPVKLNDYLFNLKQTVGVSK